MEAAFEMAHIALDFPDGAVVKGIIANRIIEIANAGEPRPGREWSHPRRRDEVAHLRLLLDAPDNAQ